MQADVRQSGVHCPNVPIPLVGGEDFLRHCCQFTQASSDSCWLRVLGFAIVAASSHTSGFLELLGSFGLDMKIPSQVSSNRAATSPSGKKMPHSRKPDPRRAWDVNLHSTGFWGEFSP